MPKLTKKQKTARKAARTRKDKKLAMQARRLKGAGKRMSKGQRAALKRVEKKAKAKKSKGGRKAGKTKAKKKTGKGKKKGGKGKAKKKGGAKKKKTGAKKKGGKAKKKNPLGYENPMAAAPKKGKKKGAKKGGKGKHKRGKYRSPDKVVEATLKLQQNCETRIARLKSEHANAIGAEKERSLKKLRREELEAKRLEERIENLRRKIELDRKVATAEEAHKGHRRGGKRRGKGRAREACETCHDNPLNPLDGWSDAAGATLGVIFGGLSTVLFDRFASTRPLTASSVSGQFTDTPANAGDVYNLNAQNLPIWSNIKHSGWKRILSAALNIGLPLWISSMVEHKGTKTFLQLWGYTAFGLTGTKVTMDLTSKMIGKTSIGQRLYSPETTAVSQQQASLTSLPSSATVYQGQGYQPTLTGYGKAAPQVGAAGCQKCGCTDTQTASVSGGPCVTQVPPPPPPRREPTPTPPGIAPAPMPVPAPHLGVGPVGVSGTPAPAAAPAAHRPPPAAVGSVHRLFPNDGPHTGVLSKKRA